MKKTPLFTSTLIAASFALSALPAWADTELPTSTSGDSFALGSGSTIDADNYTIANGASQGWFIPWVTSGGAGSYSLSFGENTTFSGTGLIGIFFNQGSGDDPESVDLTNVTASGLTGQLIVVNNWNNETDVKLLGESWSNVEYLFANAVDDTTIATKYGLTGITRGDLNSDFTGKGLNDYLALQGDTTLAGVTGASKGVTVTDSNNVTEVLCEHEFITVAEAGQTLTIAGSSEYAFYGTVGASGTEVSLTMNSSDGNGKQTFGGTNYLYAVTVSAGTLILSGANDISSAVLVNGGTLDISGTTTFGSTVTVESGTLNLAGEITLSSAISNSDTVVVDSGVTFVLDNLTPSGSDNTYTYTIISGGTIEGWGSLDYSNFSGVTSDRQINISTSGQVTIDTNESAHDLTWAGSSGGTWSNGGDSWTDSDTFAGGDNVTFTSTGAGTVTISGNIKAGTMTVSGGDYTFSASDGNTLTVTEIDMNGGNVTFDVDATIGTFNTAWGSSAAGKTIALGEGAKLSVGTLTNAWGANFTLAEGSEIDATMVTFTPGSTALTVSGSGTWKAETFQFGNGANYTFTGITLDVGTMELGVSSNSNTAVTALTFTGVTATIDKLNVYVSTPLTFSGGSADIGSMDITGAATITFTGGGKFTIGSYTEGAQNTTFAIGENTTVTVGTFSSSWGETFSFSSGSVLNVTEELTLHTNSMETMNLNGGTLNAEKLNLSNYEKLTFSSGNLNIGSGGITADSWGDHDYLVFGDGLTVGVYGGADGTNKSWSSAAVIQLEGTNTGTTFFTDTDESITITGSISGEGNLTKTGAGTLTVSTYDVTGTTTVSGGTLILTGTTSITDLTLADGSTLTLSQGNAASNTSIGTLTVSGDTVAATITSGYYEYVSIGALAGSGTLALSCSVSDTRAMIYELTGNSGDTPLTSSFSGTISLSDSNSGDYRGVTLIISDASVASGAVIEFGSEASSTGSLALGVNAETVEIAGLSSNSSGADVVYSGSVSLGAELGDGGATLIDYRGQSGYGNGSALDGVGTNRNTLVLNISGSNEYSFSGVILDMLNIEKKGAGTQSITFQLSKWTNGTYFDGTITVTEGTLNLDGIDTNSAGLTVAADATLNISNHISLAATSDIESVSSTISGTLNIESGGQLDLVGTVTINNAISNSGTITIADGTSIVVGVTMQEGSYEGKNYEYYTLIDGSNGNGTVELGSSVTFVIDDESITLSEIMPTAANDYTWNGYISGGSLYIYAETSTTAETAETLYWAGTDENSTWSTQSANTPWSATDGGEAGLYFADEANVIFGSSTATVTTVTVEGEVVATTTTINGAYTFDIGADASVTTGTLTIAEGGSLALTGEGKIVTGAASNSTALAFDASGFTGEMDFTKGYLDIANSTFNSGATVVVTANTNTTNDDGYLSDTDVSLHTGNAESNSNSEFAASLVLEGDGGVIIRTGDSTKTVTFLGSVTGTTATLQLNGGGNAVFSGTVNVGTYLNFQGATTFSGATTLGKLEFFQNGGNASDVTFSGSTAKVTALVVDQSGGSLAANLTVENGASLEVGTMTIDHNFAITIDKAAMSITGTVTQADNTTTTVTISDGGQLSLGNGVTLNVDVMNIVLSTENYDANGAGTGTYAIVGDTGSSLTFTTDVAITITVDSALETLLSNEGTYYFDISNGIVLSDESLDYSALESYGTVDYSDGILSVVVSSGAIPEPSMFGVFFGIGAIGLVATRRRRRKVA